MWLVVISVLLLLPMTIISKRQFDDANRSVEAADAANESVEEIDVLFRLGVALRVETTATGAHHGVSRVSGEIDKATGAQVAAARAVTDDLVTRFDDEEFSEVLDEQRAFVDELPAPHVPRERMYEIAARYRSMALEVDRRVDDLMSVLTEAASSAGHSNPLAVAARNAELAVRLQIQQASQTSLWGPLASPWASPSSDDVIQVTQHLAVTVEARRRLDNTLDDSTELGRAWFELRDAGQLDRLTEAIEASIDRFVRSGTDTVIEAPIADPTAVGSGEGPPSGQGSITSVMDVIELDRQLAADLESFVDVALTDVHEAAAQIDAMADDARRTVQIAVGLFAVLGFVALWVLIRVVAMPLGRMAGHARSLRDGELDDRLEELGAAELRVTARAINEATDSLKLAERQAVALAEGRMDDASMQTSAPGTLGSSLQTSVDRLAQTIAEREDFQRRLAHEASHDSLTGLPNRGAVLRRVRAAIARAERSTEEVALLFLDFDGFKDVNDTFGHAAGDTLLRETAVRLHATIRDGDSLGRLGGDEFVVVAEPLDGIEAAIELGNRLSRALTEPIVFGDVTIEPSVSIGIAMVERSGLTADELLHDADLAVYRAKRHGRGRIEVCNEDLRNRARQQAEIEAALAAALDDDGQLLVHYQPAVDARTGEVVSLEALVRWQRPDVGLVPPADFIEVAERSDLVEQVDRWVMNEVAEQLARWAGDPVLGSIPVAINASGRHLSSGRLADDVLDAIERAGIEPQRLVVEVTETALLHDLEDARRDLERLRAAGTNVALDDFGTGYMSLATLRELPVDVVKIDRSFVSGMSSTTDHSLVHLIIQTSHLLGARVVAEGVEEVEQAETLTALGADQLQGWYFGRAVKCDEIERLAVAGRLGAVVVPA